MKRLKHVLVGMVTMAILSVFATMAFGQAIADPQSPADASALLTVLMNACKSSQWTLAAAAGLMILVYALRTYFLPTLSSTAVRIWAAVLAVAAAIAVNVGAGQSWAQAILSGLTVGAAASGLWEWVGQHIFPDGSVPTVPAAPVTPPAAPSAQSVAKK